jgi:acyl transferase domain-containing protein
VADFVSYAGLTDETLANLVTSRMVGRKSLAYRAFLICRDRTDLVAPVKEMPIGFVPHNGALDVVFLFPGQGSQYVNMGRDLYNDEPVFRDSYDRCISAFSELLGSDLSGNAHNGDVDLSKDDDLIETDVCQPLLFTVEYALAELLMSWGIRPTAMLGHSLGEYVAATISGVFELSTALKIVATRSRLLDKTLAGSMLAIPLCERDASEFLTEDVCLAAVNSPSQCVLSGSKAAIRRIQSILEERGIISRKLRISRGFHSHLVDSILCEFHEELKNHRFKAHSIPFISNVTGTWISDDQATSPEYWVRHVRATVRFGDGMKKLMERSSVVLEVGPGNTLCSLLLESNLRADVSSVFPCMRDRTQHVCDKEFLLTTVGRLWQFGVHVDWPKMALLQSGYRVPMPTYPFERTRFWIDAKAPRAADLPSVATEETDAFPRAASADSFRPQSGAEQVLPGVPLGKAKDSALHPRSKLSTQYRPPLDDLEREIAQLWQEMLGISQIGLDDDLFECGGHSLLATQIVSQIRSKYDTNVPLVDFLKSPTVSTLAALVRGDISRVEITTELEQLLTEVEALTPDQARRALEQELKAQQ